MNDSIRAMARAAGFYDGREDLFWVGSEGLERFASLVAAQAAAEEREECAKVCDEIAARAAKDWKARYDPHDQGREFGADESAAAIRERK